MMQLIEQTLGAPPELTMADARYWNESGIVEQQSKGRDLLIPPDQGPDKVTGKLAANATRGDRPRKAIFCPTYCCSGSSK
jgi:hypothetical protein